MKMGPGVTARHERRFITRAGRSEREWLVPLGALVPVLVAILLATSLAAEAQQAVKIPKVGVLHPYAESARQSGFIRRAFQDVGYVEGQDILVEHRWIDKADRAAALATELVRLNVDVIVANGGLAVPAAREATTTIPIVALSADLLGTGFVASLARPGGNVTGVSLAMVDLSSKKLDLLREIVPRLRRAAFLASSTDPNGPRFVDQTRAAAEKRSIQIEPFFVRGPAEFDRTFSAIGRSRPEALIVQPLFTDHSRRIAEFAIRQRVPTLSDVSRFADEGGLMTYGPNGREYLRQLAMYVDKILKGARPADLPVQQPTKFELVINAKTAKALGLTIPPSLLLQADRVID